MNFQLLISRFELRFRSVFLIQVIDNLFVFTPYLVERSSVFLHLVAALEEVSWQEGKRSQIVVSHLLYIFCYKFNLFLRKIILQLLKISLKISDFTFRFFDKIAEYSELIFIELMSWLSYFLPFLRKLFGVLISKGSFER